MADTVFANGMFLQPRKPQTPDFVMGKFSFKVDEFIETLQRYKNDAGYVNVSMMKGRSGKPYLAVDTYGLNLQGDSSQASQPSVPPPTQDDTLQF